MQADKGLLLGAFVHLHSSQSLAELPCTELCASHACTVRRGHKES